MAQQQRFGGIHERAFAYTTFLTSFLPYPGVKRWKQTDDVLQNALIRLNRALSVVSPKSARHFWNLAVLQIHRGRLDLADRCRASPELGEHHDTDDAGKAPDDPGGAFDLHAHRTNKPDSLEAWSRFQAAAANLPEEEREVFGSKWFGGLGEEWVEKGVASRFWKRLPTPLSFPFVFSNRSEGMGAASLPDEGDRSGPPRPFLTLRPPPHFISERECPMRKVTVGAMVLAASLAEARVRPTMAVILRGCRHGPQADA